MSEKITVTYYISDDGWIYTDMFGLAELEGRIATDVGVSLVDGVKTLCIPEQVDGMDVHTIAFRGFDKGYEALYVPDGVEIILPHAFAGCSELKTVRVPEDMYDIAEGAFIGTAVPEERQKELYAMGRMREEILSHPEDSDYPDFLARIGAAEDDPEETAELKKAEKAERKERKTAEETEPGNDIPF